MTRRPPGGIALAVAALLAISLQGCADDPARLDGAQLEAEVAAWRADRETRLLKEDGWLTLVALHWLEPGETTFGTDPGNVLQLPPGAGPAFGGRLLLEDGQVTLVPVASGEIKVQGATVDGPVELVDDGSEDPSIVQVGRISFYILRRGDARAVRVRDPESPVRTGFRGLDHFAPSAKFRLSAKFRPYEELRTVEIPTVQGRVSEMIVPGTVEFRIDGQDFSLQAFADSAEDPELFLVFKDETSGKATYGLGRYLDAERQGDSVILDFNRAYNPPCAFTAFATCPLPPRQNWMTIPIPAGEKSYAKPS